MGDTVGSPHTILPPSCSPCLQMLSDVTLQAVMEGAAGSGGHAAPWQPCHSPASAITLGPRATNLPPNHYSEITEILITD